MFVSRLILKVSVKEAKEILSKSPGVHLCDLNQDFPTPLQVQKSEMVSNFPLFGLFV